MMLYQCHVCKEWETPDSDHYGLHMRKHGVNFAVMAIERDNEVRRLQKVVETLTQDKAQLELKLRLVQ